MIYSNNKRAGPVLGALVVMMLAMAPGTLALPQTPMVRDDPQCTGRSLYAGTYKPTIAWKISLGAGTSAAPVIGQNGTLYYGSFSPYINARSSDGNLIWQVRLNAAVTASSCIASDGTVYVATQKGKLYAFTSSGIPKWSNPFDFGLLATNCPLMTDTNGVIYFGAANKNVYAVNPDGTLKWSFATGGEVKQSACLSKDGSVVYATSEDGRIYAINAATGQQIWKTGIVNASTGCSVGDDGTVYFGTAAGVACAYNPGGTQKWAYQTDGKITCPITLGSDGSVFVGSYDRRLYALDSNGAFRWSFRSTAEVYSAPTIDLAGVLYFGTGDGRLIALNSTDGLEAWSLSLGTASIRTTPILDSAGSIYALDAGGYLTKLSGPVPAIPSVPEPSSLAVLGMGVFLHFARRRQRK